MIRSFKDRDTEEVFHVGTNRRWKQIEKSAQRRLIFLEVATSLIDLKVPPSNGLEALTKNRKGQHSIRISSQYRICFVWKADGPYDVEIVDYH